MRLLLEIAKSLLLARKNQTIIAAAGVTFSITMFIGLLGFMSGLNTLLDSLITNRTAHVKLYKELSPSKRQPLNKSAEFQNHYHFIANIRPKKDRQDIYKSLEIISVLEEREEVLGVSGKLNVEVFFNAGIIDFPGIVNGINVTKENKLFAFGESVIEGDIEDLNKSPNSIIIGKGLADNMLLEMGQVVQVKTSQGLTKLKIVGIYKSGMADIDKTQSFTSIQTAQKLKGVSSAYLSEIQVKLKDIELAPQLAISYAQKFNVDALDIQTANAQFDTGSSIRTLISYAVGITLLIVAGFGIYNILNMMIYDKMDSIAILKATGFSGSDVGKIFIIVALTIGVLGGVFGLLFGYGLSVLISQIPFENTSFPSIKTYPVDTKQSFYIVAIVFSIITTYLAGYFPSKKARKVDPVVIIRGK
jgi:lipoprotein-releasing system permease protein